MGEARINSTVQHNQHFPFHDLNHTRGLASCRLDCPRSSVGGTAGVLGLLRRKGQLSHTGERW